MPKRPQPAYSEAAPPTAADHEDDITTSHQSWDTTKQLIQSLIDEYSTSNAVQVAKDCMTLNAMLEDKQREVVALADERIDSLHEQIRLVREACGAAADDLASHQDHISQLEGEAAELRRRNDALLAARREAQARVVRYRAEAEEQMDGIDAVEANRMDGVTKIQMQISLYAKVVGIKWNYDESMNGILKGEVVS